MKYLAIISAFSVSMVFINCNKPIGCEETRGLISSFFGITIINTSTGKYMYPQDEFQSIFKRDSLQVFNEGGRKFNFVNFGLTQDPSNSLNQYYGVNISPAFIVPDDSDAFNQEKTRKIFLKYNYSTSDTLTLVFKAYKDKCGNGQYEYLKVFFRGSMIASADHTYYATFTLNH